MITYTSRGSRRRGGRQRYKPSFEELEELDKESLGLCLACGSTHLAEPDARKYTCEACGEDRVYGAAELVLMDLFYFESEKAKE